MFKKQNFIAKHNSKVAKNMRRFAKDHPQLTGVSCTVGGVVVVTKAAASVAGAITGISIARKVKKFFQDEDAVDQYTDVLINAIDKASDELTKVVSEAVNTVDATGETID